MSEAVVQRARGRGQMHPGVAILIAPVISSALFTLGIVLLGQVTGSPMPIEVALIFWLYVGLISLFFAATLGMLWHWFAMKRGWREWRYYFLAGAGTGAILSVIPIALFTIPGAVGVSWSGFAWALAIGVMNGAAAATVFWFLRRPDRDSMKNVATLFE